MSPSRATLEIKQRDGLMLMLKEGRCRCEVWDIENLAGDHVPECLGNYPLRNQGILIGWSCRGTANRYLPHQRRQHPEFFWIAFNCVWTQDNSRVKMLAHRATQQSLRRRTSSSLPYLSAMKTSHLSVHYRTSC